MIRVRVFSSVVVIVFFLWIHAFELQASERSSLSQRDLAILLPVDDPDLRLGLANSRFSLGWYQGILDAYGESSVGDAVERENSPGSWQLVAVRVVPCQSLFSRPHVSETSFCWPEVRLVLQPIENSIEFIGRRIPYFADDRAIHVLYNFETTSEAFPSQIIEALRYRLESADGSAPQGQEWDIFESFRDRAINQLIQNVSDLRDVRIDGDQYFGFDLRPESQAQSVDVRRSFRIRLSNFLEKVSSPSSSRVNLPKEVTSFSLPEGREPTMIDEWVFLKLKPSSLNTIESESITLVSARDGKTLSSVPFARVSMSRDDQRIYEDYESFRGTPYELDFRENLILFVSDVRKNMKRISDVTKVRVSNTTCGSCHKLNPERFDFHNLSYLQERPITVSPRVEADVAYDLKWLDSWLRTHSRPLDD